MKKAYERPIAQIYMAEPRDVLSSSQNEQKPPKGYDPSATDIEW